MHAFQILYQCLTSRCPGIHQKRLTSLCAAAMAAVSGSVLSVSDLGRGMMGRVSIKHNIKRVDRLLGNRALHAEIPLLYTALCRSIVGEMRRPLIIVDWSDMAPDRAWQLLRASLALDGRSVTLYEEVHPLANATSRQVHAAFLAALATMLPAGCVPVVLTDAGFRSTWFSLVERMGWMWIGRIRNRDMIRPLDGDTWEGCKLLYPKATGSAKSLGWYDYVREHPVRCRLVLVKHVGTGRHHTRLDGSPSRSAHSRKKAKAQLEPWLLATCPALAALNPESIVALYAKRMQIEEAFRDLKNERLGLGLSASRSTNPDRLRVLLLIGALATFVLRCIGEVASEKRLNRQCQSNTRQSRPVLSVITLARQLVRKTVSVWANEKFDAVFQRLKNDPVEII
jgi:hypothetical protein